MKSHDKHDRVVRICELLDICRGCEFSKVVYNAKKNRTSKVRHECLACNVYNEMRELGNEINKSVR